MIKSENISWQEALEKLKEGNEHFIEDKLDGKLQNSARRQELLQSQHPFAVILGCADSRVVPEIVFDTGLGEIFVIRVAGNTANKSSIASIEYAVAKLGVELVVVLGHESCGAITSALANKTYGGSLDYLMNFFKPSIIDYKQDNVNEVVKRHAKLTCEQLVEKSEIIKEAFVNDYVKIIPAFYHMESGRVEFL